jgi:hypothetical protein
MYRLLKKHKEAAGSAARLCGDAEGGPGASLLFVSAWGLVSTVLAVQAEAEEKLVRDLRENCTDALESFGAQYKAQRKSILEASASLSKTLAAAQDAAKAARSSHHRAAAAAEAAELAVEAAARDGLDVDAARAKATKRQADAEREEAAHRAAVDAANAAADEYYVSDSGIRKVLAELQTLELMRRQKTKLVVQKWARAMSDYATALAGSASTVTERARVELDAKNDMSLFLDAVGTDEGPPPPLEFEPYTKGNMEAKAPSKVGLMYRRGMAKLGETGSVEETGGSHSPSLGALPVVQDSPLFGQPLRHLMTRQLSDYPQLEVPMILPALLEAIRDAGGFSLQGIFREAVGAGELREFVGRLEADEYTLDGASTAHVPACLLKKWLRELPSPLIGDALYESAISSTSPADALAVFGRLGPLEQRTVRMLCLFLAELSAEAETNRMTVTNLAVVFAPCLLRTPSPDLLITNAQAERTFVAHLLTAAPLLPLPAPGTPLESRRRRSRRPTGTAGGSPLASSTPSATASSPLPSSSPLAGSPDASSSPSRPHRRRASSAAASHSRGSSGLRTAPGESDTNSPSSAATLRGRLQGRLAKGWQRKP